MVLQGDLKEVIQQLAELTGPTVIQLHKSIEDDKTVLLRKKLRVGASSDGSPAYLEKKLNFGSGAYAYLMNREAAVIAVRESFGRKVINILDWPYLWRHKVDFWGMALNFIDWAIQGGRSTLIMW